MGDEPSWLLRRQTDVLRSTRAEARGLWDDSASRHVEERYLRPHESDSSRVVDSLTEQEAALDDVRRFVDEVRNAGVEAHQHAEQFVQEADHCQQDLSTSHDFRGRALRDESVAAQHESRALQAAQEANTTCGGCPADGGYTGTGISVVYHAPAAVPEAGAMTVADDDALADYTGLGHQAINHALWAGTIDELGAMAGRIQAVDQALAKLPTYDGVVQRGVRLSQEEMDRYVPGSVVVDNGFTSTTRSAGDQFPGNTLFAIRSRTGRELGWHSTIPAENEVLFTRFTRFNVLANEVHPESGLRIIYMEEV